MLTALRFRDDVVTANRMLERARAFNAVMFDCRDPMACRYAMRIDRIHALIATTVTVSS